MSRITYSAADYVAPELGVLGERRGAGVLPAAAALAGVHIPLAISGTVTGLFFVAYWLPELGGVAGFDLVLGQLAPLASKELTSESTPLVAAQADRTGLTAAYLLVASLVLPPLARARHWLVRLTLWPVTYLGVLCCLVSALGVAVRGQLGDTLLGVLLLAVWAAAAAVTTWRSLWVDVDRLPRRSTTGIGWLLAAYAVVTPVPIAVGRRLFAPDLRSAALEMRDGGFALRWSALISPGTLPLYLSGVLVAAVVALAYLLVPPRRAVRSVRVWVATGIAVLCLALTGAWGAAAGAHRVEELRTASPAATMTFRCGSWVVRPPGGPAETLVGTGATCRRLASYVGYRKTATRELAGSISPVAAATPEGRRVPNRILIARYGPVLVVATTRRFDNRPDELVGLRRADLALLWSYRCPGGVPFRLRFAGADGGDDPAAGRISARGEGPVTVVACSERPDAPVGLLRLDARGRPR